VRNIHSLLRTGGEILLVFFGTAPIYNVFEIMSQKPEWQPYKKVRLPMYCIYVVNSNNKFAKNIHK
jgi:hypothetical protein